MANAITRRLAVSAFSLLAFGARRAPGAAPREIRMVARRFVFEPNTLAVQAGEPLVIRLTAPEVPMGFSLPDFHVRADVVPGRDTVVQFTPDKAGDFTFVCDVFCGNGHEDMSGTLTVRA